jgi:hypothetical protein
MKLMDKGNSQKGQTGLMTILVVVGLGVGVFFLIKHYKNRNNDIVIHIPKVEVH